MRARLVRDQVSGHDPVTCLANMRQPGVSMNLPRINQRRAGVAGFGQLQC